MSKSRIRSIALVILISFCVSITTMAQSEISYEKEAKALYDLGLFDGISATSYQPALEQSANREQAMKLIAKAFNWEIDMNAVSGFEDVSDWAEPYVKKAVELGVTNGIGDGKFGALDPVNGRQMSTWLLRALGVESATAWNDTDNQLTQKNLSIESDENVAYNRNLLVKAIYETLMVKTLRSDLRKQASDSGGIRYYNVHSFIEEPYLIILDNELDDEDNIEVQEIQNMDDYRSLYDNYLKKNISEKTMMIIVEALFGDDYWIRTGYCDDLKGLHFQNRELQIGFKMISDNEYAFTHCASSVPSQQWFNQVIGEKILKTSSVKEANTPENELKYTMSLDNYSGDITIRANSDTEIIEEILILMYTDEFSDLLKGL